MKIIARNFYNREDSLKWLIRDNHQEAKLAGAVAMILALNVTFAESTAYESGFGCSVVAYADSAEWNSDRYEVREYSDHKDAARIRFNGHTFTDVDGNTITGCDRLFLLADGEMYGTGLRYELGNLNSYGNYLSWKTIGPEGPRAVTKQDFAEA
jgi:hypothetical protein